MRNEKIYLPSLKRVKISNYSLYNMDIDYEFINGLNLIIGGNGVGKTTFISIIKYALIGLYKKDLDVRVYKGEKRLVRGKYTNCNTFFRNRTKENENDKDGCVELWFEINELLFYVKRSLFDIKIVEAKYYENGKQYLIEGESIRQDLYKGSEYYEEHKKERNLQYNYEIHLAKAANLSDFEDFIFFVNQILLFGESRENVLWSKDVQQRLLSSFLNDAELERKRKEYSLEAKYQDSIARHKQEEIKAIVRVINQIDGNNNNGEKVKKDELLLNSEVERLERALIDTQSDRDVLQKKIERLYKDISLLSKKINEKEKEKQIEENKVKNEYWPGVNPKYDVYKRQYIGNQICPICNASLEGKEIQDENDKCFFCNTEIVIDESKLMELNKIKDRLKSLIKERKEAEGMVITYEKELKKIDSLYRKNKVEYFKRQNELRTFEVADFSRNKADESSYRAMKNRIEELTIEKEMAVESSEKMKKECEKILVEIQGNVNNITRNISGIFKEFAESFMRLPCYLTTEKFKESALKLFVPVIDNKPRYDQDALSESQRFFVDYSFRMSLLSYFYEKPSFYICETPDSSLDISYEENAADVFIKYLEQPNVLILTSNLNNSTFIKSILRKTSKRKVLNLLKYGKISLVQQNHQLLNALSNEIEEMCNEKI